MHLFSLLNAGKESIALDFADRSDRALLTRVIAAADLVVEGSRPRAMDDLGIDPDEVRHCSATSWLSITGHGRTAQPGRVGFGDDAAVAGGLWLESSDRPMFVADAVADPLTGLAAAALAAEMLASEVPAVIEVPLVRAAAWANQATAAVRARGSDAEGWWVEADGERVAVSAPRSRSPKARAVALDAHGRAIRDEFADR